MMKKRKVLSHPLSKMVRRVLDPARYKGQVVRSAAAAIIAVNSLVLPTQAFDYTVAATSILPEEREAVVTTDTNYKFPVVSPTGISQHYQRFHPGIDVRAPKGTPVIAVADGVIVEVQRLRVGYGHYVRVAHAGTVSSLYAHLDRIDVEVGQKISKAEVIGTVGSTGWSTGPHLHFEINEGNKTINPRLVLPI